MKDTLLHHPWVPFSVLYVGACFLVFLRDFLRHLASPKTAAGRREPGASTNELSFPTAGGGFGCSCAATGGESALPWFALPALGSPAVKVRCHRGALPPGAPLAGFGCSCEEREVTVLFADVRGFTSFSEKRTAKEVLALLGAYYAMVLPILEQHQSMGDGFLAVFGMTPSAQDHGLKGAQAAVALVRRVREQAGLWADLGFPDLRIRVGVNTGVAAMGVVGGQAWPCYSAFGDTVNAAARIEEANKEQGTEVLFGAATVRALQELAPCEAEKLGVEREPRRLVARGLSKELLMYAARVP
jgi:class 3 adenylate cyclase